MRYDPSSFKGLSFHDAVPHFSTGHDTPRAYLERCLALVAARGSVLQAFAVANEALARAAADPSSARWKAGRPLSAIDGMPIAFDTASAAERALRASGAVMLGQPVTRALGDSSECSAAAVAARLCPAALSTPVHGSVIRGASHCGNFAFEPTPGACDRAEQHEGTAVGTAAATPSLPALRPRASRPQHGGHAA